MAGSQEPYRVQGLSSGASPRSGPASVSPSGISSVERTVNELILRAFRMGASDVHLEPSPDHLLVRARTDGVLQPLDRVPGDQMKQVIARLKIMSNLDPNAGALPCDGRFPFGKFEPTARELDIRSTFVPTFFGEKAVLRLVDHSKLQLTLDEIGFTPEGERLYQQVVGRSSGLVVHAGPQGCGKTTTAYAALKNVPRPNASVVTVEETVEYVLPSLTQVQLNPEQGLDYARAVQGVLRQDPDVILIGEIKDAGTARIAVEAAMSGRLVLTTLHATSSVNALARLVELGFTRAQVAHALAGIVSQRLVRRLCPDCRERVSPSTLIRSAIALPPTCTAVYKPKGCRKCGSKGFRGRVAVFEVYVATDRLREAFASGAPPAAIEALAVSEGTIPLLRDAVDKVVQGAIAVEEMLRTLCGVAVDDVSAITEPGEMVNFLKTVRDQFLPPSPAAPSTPAHAAPAQPPPPAVAPPALAYGSPPAYQRAPRPATATFPSSMLDDGTQAQARPASLEVRPPSGLYRLPLADDPYRAGVQPQPPSAPPPLVHAPPPASGSVPRPPETRGQDELLRQLLASLPPEIVAQIARAAAGGGPVPHLQPGVTGRLNPAELMQKLQELQRRMAPPPG